MPVRFRAFALSYLWALLHQYFWSVDRNLLLFIEGSSLTFRC